MVTCMYVLLPNACQQCICILDHHMPHHRSSFLWSAEWLLLRLAALSVGGGARLVQHGRDILALVPVCGAHDQGIDVLCGMAKRTAGDRQQSTASSMTWSGCQNSHADAKTKAPCSNVIWH
jgi:hypothetical protein